MSPIISRARNICRATCLIRKKTMKKKRGFTLLEVLLALTIFTSLSMAANQVFRNVLNSDEQMLEVGNALKNLQKTLIILDSDFRQIMARQYRNGGGESREQLLEVEKTLLESESGGIRFVRGGWVNPQQLFPRGEVVKVAYRIREAKLERIRWMYPDDSVATEPAEMLVMEGVKDIGFEMFNGSAWSETWSKTLEMPKAIRVSLDTERYGKITRVYILPEQKLTKASQQGAGSS